MQGAKPTRNWWFPWTIPSVSRFLRSNFVQGQLSRRTIIRMRFRSLSMENRKFSPNDSHVQCNCVSFSRYSPIVWLIDWLIDCLFDWLIVRLIDWLIVRLIDWFVTVLSVDWLIDLIDRLCILKSFVKFSVFVIAGREEAQRQNTATSEEISRGLVIVSENNFPTAAGLASSAAGFACLGNMKWKFHFRCGKKCLF